MDDRSIHASNPKALATFFGGSDEVWGEEDLAAILRHQLSAPLGFDLKRMGADSRKTVAHFTRSSTQRLKTFADLFGHPDPPVDLLSLAKEFGKTADGGTVPRDVGLVLYYAAVLVARLRCDSRISDLSDSDLLTGVEWVLRRTWLDESMRHLFEQGAKFLRPPEPA